MFNVKSTNGKYTFIVVCLIVIFGSIYYLFNKDYDSPKTEVVTEGNEHILVNKIEEEDFLKGLIAKLPLIDSTVFVYGKLGEGCISYINNANAVLYSDSLLSKKVAFKTSFAQKIQVISNHKPILYNQILRNVVSIKYLDNGVEKYAFVNENDLVLKEIKLNSEISLFVIFDKLPPHNYLQGFEVLMVDKSELKIIKYKSILACGLEQVEGSNHYYYNYYIDYELKSACSKLTNIDYTLSLNFAYDACGYTNSEYLMLFNDDDFFISKELNKMGEATISHFREEIITPCENELIKNNHLVYYIKSDEYSDDVTKVFNDSIAIDLFFDENKGLVILDTLCKKKWTSKTTD